MKTKTESPPETPSEAPTQRAWYHRLVSLIWSKRGGQAHEENTRRYHEMLRASMDNQPLTSAQCVTFDWSPEMIAFFEDMSVAESKANKQLHNPAKSD